jgi:hypothetical protein
VSRTSTSAIACLCAVGSACIGQPFPAQQATEVYAQATNQFGAAIFFKPTQATNADLTCQLTPLIIQQVADGQPLAGVPCDQFSAPGISNGLLVIDPARPAVYWAADSLQLNRQTHARFAYQWCYPPRKPPAQPSALPRQGVRITLDSRGQPAIWEILADTSARRLIFVSQSLEAAAAAESGKPLPGRRYSIERSLDQAPHVVVPRVIDDGPQAMGPIVYLSEGTRNVSTLICRCMPAQVKQLIATRTFALAPLDVTDLRAFLAAAGTATNTSPVSWPGDERVENRLNECLRLPEKF